MADKLAVWNQALVHLEAAPIATLTDSVMAVNVFGNAWDGVVAEAFTEGDWNFAKRTALLVESTTGTASLGWSYIYDYPSDYERTVEVSPDNRFDNPFTAFLDEDGYLNSNTTPLYIRYISNLQDYGYDIHNWPTLFWRYVALKLAYETCGRLTQSTTLEDRLEKRLTKALRKAKNVDARNEPYKKTVNSSWLKARGADSGNTSINAGSEIVMTEGTI